MLGYLLGIILLIEAALMVFPITVALAYGESVLPFIITVLALLIVSVPLVFFKKTNKRIYAKEGFVCSAAGWILLSLFGTLPFVISGAIPNFVDALFETVSGFTTTGASLLTDIESLPKSILFWRSFTHWIGGMGVLVFMLAIIPSSGGQSMHLMRAEVTGPTKGKLVPKTQKSALILYGIYIVLTVVQMVVLMFCGFSLYDSAVTAFATAGTGGFSVLNASIAGYANPAAEWVIAVFMLLFGINFNLFYFALIGKIRDIFKNEELRAYLAIVVTSTVAITLNTLKLFDNVGSCIRAAFFQVASIMSTTGFVTVDFNLWPEFSRALVVVLTVIGACAGSTAGGLKISRILILLKSAVKEVKQMLRPRSVNVIKLDGEPVSDATVHSARGYFIIYAALIILTTLVISLDGFSFETNFTAVLTCINNVGPGLGAVGPMGNFSGFSALSKLILSVNMLIGRLEIMPIVILMSPMTWKKR